jgi:hypothetical protein
VAALRGAVVAFRVGIVMRRTCALAVLAGLAVIGCGGDDSGGGGETDSDESSVARDIQPEAKARAESLVLRLSDFPNGWRASPAEDQDKASSEGRACAGTDFSGFTVTGTAESQEFAKAQAEASSEASIFESADDAHAAIAEFGQGLGRSTTEDCFRDLLVKAALEEDSGEEYKVGEVDIGELSFSPPAVEEARVWQIAIPIEVQGLAPTVYLDFSLLREGDAVATVTTVDVFDPFDPDLRDDLLKALAGRVSGVQRD